MLALSGKAARMTRAAAIKMSFSLKTKRTPRTTKQKRP
jgi:hypothetical protein